MARVTRKHGACATPESGKPQETQAGHLVLVNFSMKFRKIKRAMEMADHRCSSRQRRQREASV